jgi:signal-transduction protein with cAMP-binding, CBS, and nucleotidyltransferase domain
VIGDGPRQIAGCARRIPTKILEDAGSTPATSTTGRRVAASARMGFTGRSGGRGMTSESREELLARVPLFQGLTHRQLRDVSGLMTPISVKAGKTLTREGALGQEFFVVLDGEVEVTHDGKTLAVCGAGGYFGEIALLDNRPRTATVTAKTDVLVEVLDRREFAALLRKSPEISSQIMATMAQRLAELEESERS